MALIAGAALRLGGPEAVEQHQRPYETNDQLLQRYPRIAQALIQSASEHHEKRNVAGNDAANAGGHADGIETQHAG